VGAVVAALSCLLAGFQSAPESEAVRAAAEALLSDLHARGLFNGAVVLGRNGEIVYEGAWGPANVEAGVPFTPDSPVDGGSLAKNFTATAVWMLVDEGKLDLDAAVRRHVPEFPYSKTTVRHLIEHSAALPDWEEWGGLTNDGMVRELRKRRIPPRFTPGSRYEYCNACYDVAALIVERVSGEKWDAFLRKRVFDPLGMESTFLRPVRFADWVGVRTLSYRRVDGELSIFDVYDHEALYGGSNLYFSARDLHRWITSWYSHPVLSDAALARGMEVPVFANAERSAFNRLSWYPLPERQAYVFTGHWKGFHHEIYWDADGRVSVVWVTNVLEAKPLPPLLTRALIDIVEGKAPRLPIADPVFRAPENGENLTPLTGTFDVPSVGRVTVTADGDALFFQVDDGARHRGFPAGSYTIPDFYARVWFSGMEAGRYRKLHWLSLPGVATGERLSPADE
jgi:CubicO group peptidase (beta-lactamase class C family)